MARIIAILTLMALLWSCGTVKKSTASQSSVHKESGYKETGKERLTYEEVRYGDRLSGIIPIRNLGRLPLVVPVRSKGLELELTITDSTIAYRSIARPVARSSLTWSSEKQKEEKVSQTATESETITKERKSFPLPWWLIVGGIVAVAVVVLRLLNVISNPFKLFKR